MWRSGGAARRAGTPLALLAAFVATPAVAADPVLSHAILPARGRAEAVVTVPAFGRYSITAASPQGTALQLVDRVAGPGDVQGTVGKTDGRLDVFLERGDYKVVAFSPEKGSGDVQLRARAFTEQSTPAPPVLVELKAVETTLDDFEQRSYWIEVPERRRVVVEAAGRNLADLRLWTNGSWLVDAEPVREVVAAVPGRAMLVCRLTADLGPGFYLLTAYGGASQPQAEETTQHPLHLRLGIPRLPAIGRRRFTASPFGADRWLVPGQASYFRLELPEPRPATLRVATNPGDPFAAEGSTASIGKNSLVPVAGLEVGSASADRVVTVSAAPGQAYVLQHMDVGNPAPCGRYWSVDHPGKYWVSSVHSGDPGDSVDATGVVMRWKATQDRHVRPVAAEVVAVGPGTPWVRRANLLDTTTVLVRIERAGRYEILARGVDARFRIEPFLVTPMANYTRPEARAPGSPWDLDAGYYVVTADPVKKGIADLALHVAGERDPFARLEAGGSSRQIAVQFPELKVGRGDGYTIFLNQQPEVRTGLAVRRLPLDLRDALPVTQRPGEALSTRFRATEDGTLHAETEDGTPVALSVDGGTPLPAPVVKRGLHRLDVAAPAKETIAYALVLEPLRLQAAAPLPALPDPSRAVPPELPLLTDRAPRFFDLERHADRTFLVRADVPALYRLQTTGLLATDGRLRTRTVTAFARESQNGVGRNFFIEHYLREGDYQVTVAAAGTSTGHLGLTLERATPIDGGELVEGGPARRTLAAGEAVIYRFAIAEAGDYRVRSFGDGTTFRCRLEDDAGWPIEPPGVNADLTRRFEAGTYRIVSLPAPVASRRLTLFERVREPPKRDGHGPHELRLAERATHVWTEPASGEARVPDGWVLAVPAPIAARIELGSEMQGDLVRLDGDGTPASVATVPAGRGWTGKLAAGRYRLDVVCARPNNRVTYDVAVFPDELVAGLDRDVSAPATVPLSVGREGLVRLASFGSADVRARVYDASDRLVAENDDGADDWNFQIQTRLAAGAYRLHVDPVGRASAETMVSMRAPDEKARPPLALPVKTDVVLDEAVEVFPLSLKADAELVLVAATAPESVGCAVEDADGAAVGVAVGRTARVEVARTHGAEYRLRLWSVDGRATRTHLTVAAVSLPRTPEIELAHGVALTLVRGIDPSVRAAAVGLDRPGTFRVPAGIRACAAPGEACREPANGLVAATGDVLWLVRDRGEKPVKGARVTLGATPLQLEVDGRRPVACDLGRTKGGPRLVVATSLAGEPGVEVVERGAPVAPHAPGDAMAVGRHAAAAVGIAGEPTAVLWAAAGPPAQLAARAWSFPAPVPDAALAGGGDLDATLAGVGASAWDLPPGPKRIRLALGAATVAALSEGDRVTSVHWRGDEPFEETADTTASRVTLLHTRGTDDHVHVEVLPLGTTPIAPALAPGTTYERADLRAGTLRLRIAPGDAARPLSVHVRGRDVEGVLIGGDGRVARGVDLPAGGAGGALVLQHGPGLVLAWVDRPGEEAADLWNGGGARGETVVVPPAAVPLAGRVQALRVTPAGPAMLHLRTAIPVVTLLEPGEGAAEVAVHETGALLDRYMEGPVRLGLRAVGGASLWGTAELTTSAVTPIGEGLGPAVLLPAGTTALFSFTVTRDGPVGIGVRATPDVVTATLLDAQGKQLGTGVVQMPTLQPGTYLLALRVPPAAGPVTVRPALAGIELPGTGPPDEVVRQYIAMAEGR